MDLEEITKKAVKLKVRRPFESEDERKSHNQHQSYISMP
jgi:ElaB/YqjD/DUF883 family membrane-anchored ribosome-binding protein